MLVGHCCGKLIPAINFSFPTGQIYSLVAIVMENPFKMHNINPAVINTDNFPAFFHKFSPSFLDKSILANKPEN